MSTSLSQSSLVSEEATTSVGAVIVINSPNIVVAATAPAVEVGVVIVVANGVEPIDRIPEV